VWQLAAIGVLQGLGVLVVQPATFMTQDFYIFALHPAIAAVDLLLPQERGKFVGYVSAYMPPRSTQVATLVAHAAMHM
jgi:hypothetical protein